MEHLPVLVLHKFNNNNVQDVVAESYYIFNALKLYKEILMQNKNLSLQNREIKHSLSPDNRYYLP